MKSFFNRTKQLKIIARSRIIFCPAFLVFTTAILSKHFAEKPLLGASERNRREKGKKKKLAADNSAERITEMQILSSGSFINLENQEKIEQLIFTAAEIANAAHQTGGFSNEEENNQKFAREIWQGAEYMCRDAEEARIKNIFINAFLERLRELRGGDEKNETPGEVLEEVSQEITAESIEKSAASNDEFLGYIQAEESGENSDSQEQILIRDDTKRTLNNENELIQSENEFDENYAEKSEDLKLIESEQISISPPVIAENAKIEVEKATESVEKKRNAKIDTTPKTADDDALELPEKEPYQFDKCTITATIQLFPRVENASTRKAVLSVRTHDFAPNISMVELEGSDLLAALLPELEKVLAKYKSDLPVKVMDKLRKEKDAPKKKAKSSATEIKSVSPVTANDAEANREKPSPTEKAEATQTKIVESIPPQTQAGQQGSLFGF